MSKAKAVAKIKNDEKASFVTPEQVCLVMPGNDLMTILSLANTISMDVKMNFHPNGLSIRTVDASHVAMMMVEYGDVHPAHRSQHSVVIDCADVLGVLKKGLGKAKGRGAKRESEYTLLFESFEANGKYSISDVDGRFKVTKKGMDLNTVVEPQLPYITWGASFEMPAVKLLEKLEFCKMGGDLIRIEVDEKDVNIKTAGELTEMSTKGDSSSIETGKLGQVAAQYSLTYLVPLVKALKGQNLKVSTGESFPLKIEGVWDFGYETKPLKFTYFLAPRVESDY